MRVDRVFRAGPTPGAEGEDCWWIIDYKTTHAGSLDPAQALPELRKLFAPQVEAYAGTPAQPARRGRARTRWPLLSRACQLLDWWEI